MESFILKNIYFEPWVVEKVTASLNPCFALNPSEDQNSPVLEEGEVRQPDVHKGKGEVNFELHEQSRPVLLETPCADAILQENHKSPIGGTPSPSYA